MIWPEAVAIPALRAAPAGMRMVQNGHIPDNVDGNANCHQPHKSNPKEETSAPNQIHAAVADHGPCPDSSP
eukprot:12921658-Prorocentrum_lima.AAC.1